MERKKCKDCNQTKDLSEFHLDRGKPRCNCKSCHNEKKKINYQIKKDSYIKKMRDYDQSPLSKQKRKARYSNRIKKDPIFKLKKTYRSRLNKAITGWCRSKKSMEILGCSWDEFKIHIEKQFTEGMAWENHGEWHIDHIIPLASAGSLTEIETLSHFSNLQPLWAKDNLSKGST